MPLAFFAAACRARSTPASPPPADGAPEAIAATVIEAGPPSTKHDVSAHCLPLPLRQYRLDSAWSIGSRTFMCLRPPYEPASKTSRLCLSVDRSDGSYRAEPSTSTGTRVRPTPAVLAAKSGKLAYSLVGGLRTPYGARQTLTDLTTGTSKTANLDYDEHIAFDGFIGNAVVLRTWLDEGPGCGRWLLDPTKTWPLVTSFGVDLGNCQGHPTLLLEATKGRTAFVSGDGTSVTFVDASLLVTRVEIGGMVTPVDGNLEILVGDAGRWLFAFGSGQAADVVELEVDAMKLGRSFSPAICPP